MLRAAAQRLEDQELGSLLLPPVAALGDMIGQAKDDEAGNAGHPGLLR